MRYLYAISTAVNRIDAFKYRIDRQGQIVRYERLDVLTPIRISPKRGFATVRLPYYEQWDRFHQEARIILQEATSASAYGAENSLKEFDVVLVSATLIYILSPLPIP